MPDPLVHLPLPGAPLLERAATGAAVAVRRAAPLARFVFRGDAVAAGKAGAAFAASLPLQPLAANVVGARAALWLGPDEWLLLARPDAPPAASPAGGSPPAEVPAPAAVDELGRRVAGEIAAALGAVPHSLVAVSERQGALLVAGPGACDLLNAHVFLDLDPAAFPVGRVTRTLFAKAEIVLWRTGETAFAIEAWTSFLPYLEGLLAEPV